MLFDDINFNIFVLFWVSPKCLHFFRDPFFFFFGRGVIGFIFHVEALFSSAYDPELSIHLYEWGSRWKTHCKGSVSVFTERKR